MVRPERVLRLGGVLVLVVVLLSASQLSAFPMRPRLRKPGMGPFGLRLRVPAKQNSNKMLGSVLPALLHRVVGGYRVRSKRVVSRRRLAAAGVSEVVSVGGGAPASAPQSVPAPSEAAEGSPLSSSILIRYTGGAGYKSLYAGCVKVLRETFPNVCIRKVILGNMATGARKAGSKGIFEVIVGDQVYSKQKESSGVYLPMQDISVILDRMSQHRKEGDDRRSPSHVWNKFIDEEGNLQGS